MIKEYSGLRSVILTTCLYLMPMYKCVICVEIYIHVSHITLQGCVLAEGHWYIIVF
jgi:hypothetical protein